MRPDCRRFAPPRRSTARRGHGPWVQPRSCASCAAEPPGPDRPAPRSGLLPVPLHAAILAQVGCTDLQHGFGPALRPELFRPLDPAVQLLDDALDAGTADGQSQPPILGVAHLVAVAL